MKMDYKKAGVDVAAGDALVDWLRATQAPNAPHKDKIVSGIGGFAALFRADFSSMKEPCLVSCTDGVGTKVKLASDSGRYEEVAQDLVAMCVNDMVCCGAEPLFFLDYYASGRLELDAAKAFLGGVRKACAESNCALIGGETAEMPGVYQKNDFDCAGFSVGVVDKAEALGPHRVKVGSRMIAIASSGFHSNGFSLLRRIFAEDLERWLDRLLTPTALYVKLAAGFKKLRGLQALAHITGGGMDNLPRVLPEGCCAEIDGWEIPYPFYEVHRRSGMSLDEMVRTLNCGVGMVAVVEPAQVNAFLASAAESGYKAWEFGSIVASSDVEATWRFKTEPTWRKND